MSLVEKALKKMQGEAAVPERVNPGTQRASDGVPEVARAAPAIPLTVSSLQSGCRSDKVVHVNPGALRARGFLPRPEDERRLAGEYRQIKRPIMAIAKGKDRGVPPPQSARVVMVASAMPGEGKTFTSINLALSMALEKDTSVLLVDGDMARSQVSRAFELQGEPGLMDLLLDESRDTASVIVPTDMRGLSLLPAGREAANATELLASSHMEKVVAELLGRDPTRIVLFDSPPLLLTTESRALTSVAGQVLVVVRAEETTHRAVLDALACVGEGKSVGLVLNHCETTGGNLYYGYGEYGQTAAADTGRQ